MKHAPGGLLARSPKNIPLVAFKKSQKKIIWRNGITPNEGNNNWIIQGVFAFFSIPSGFSLHQIPGTSWYQPAEKTHPLFSILSLEITAW